MKVVPVSIPMTNYTTHLIDLLPSDHSMMVLMPMTILMIVPLHLIIPMIMSMQVVLIHLIVATTMVVTAMKVVPVSIPMTNYTTHLIDLLPSDHSMMVLMLMTILMMVPTTMHLMVEITMKVVPIPMIEFCYLLFPYWGLLRELHLPYTHMVMMIILMRFCFRLMIMNHLLVGMTIEVVSMSISVPIPIPMPIIIILVSFPEMPVMMPMIIQTTLLEIWYVDLRFYSSCLCS